MKYLVSLVLALVGVMLIVNVASEVVLPDGEAVAARVEGTVLLFTSESTTGRLIKNNDRIAEDDRVEVQENSRLELRLPDGGCLRLAENARLTMGLLEFEKQTGTLHLQAFLHHGRVWARINKHATPDSWVEVITNTGLVSAKDIVCALDAVEDVSTTVNVYEGVVLAVRAAKEAPQAVVPPVSVQTLQQVSASAQEGVSQPRDFDPKATINDWIRWNLQRDAREELATITIAPAVSTITKGASLQYSGVAHYPGNIEKDVTWFATWSSSDGNVAKIDPSGVAAGTELGAATISAAIDDMNGSTMLNVDRDLIAIAVTPSSKAIANGAVQQFTARGTFSDRTVKDITSSVVWSSSNTNVAFVDAAGRAVGGNATGAVVISASLGTKRGSATLKVRRELVSIAVMPANATVMSGEIQRFGAIGSYSDKTTQDLTETVEWRTSNAGIAEIDMAEAGRVIGKDKAGSATLTALFKGKSGTGAITVYLRPSP